MENQSPDRLDSWKEIAVYLKKNIRTCQRWHRDYGLPVRRYVDSSRSRIFADKQEIDEWLKSRCTQSQSRNQDSAKIGVRRVLVPTGIIVFIAGAYLFLNRFPQSYSIEGTHLRFMDGRGRNLLQYDTRIPNQDPIEHKVISYGGANDFSSPRDFPQIVINLKKPLFLWEAVLLMPTSNRAFDDMVYCVSRWGHLRWRYRTELDVVLGLESRDIDGDGRVETIILSTMRDESSSEIAVIDEQGKIKAKFLHPGALFDFICIDIIGDQKREIIAVGEYRPLNLPAMAVLELNKLYSIRQPQMDALPEELIQSAEYYVLFPDDPIERKHFRRQPLRRVLASDASLEKIFIVRNLKIYRFDLAGISIEVKPTTRYYLEFPFEKANSTENRILEHLLSLERYGLRYYDGNEFLDRTTQILN